MNEILISLGLFVVGLAVMIYSAEKLVKGIVGVSLGFGISAFVITAIFVGFDPENLATGGAGAFNGIHGIAIGSILGAIMVPMAFAFGITALLTRLKFKKVSKPILWLPILIISLFYLLSIDGIISRVDGIVLILTFVVTTIYLFRASKKGLDIKPEGELEESLEEAEKLSKWKSIFIFISALIGIVIGSQLMVDSAKPLISFFGISDTVFGMTIIAFLVSIEELAKQLPAAMKGRSDISYGNMIGSVIHFFLLNAGIIALINPILISPIVLTFYFPMVLITSIFISLIMLRKEFPKWAGVVLILLYVVFAVVGYII